MKFDWRKTAAVLGTTACAAAQAQQPAQTVTITGSAASQSVGVAGFGDVPLHRMPLSATVVSTAQLQDAGIAALADITRLDASLADAYNAPGYWGQVSVRGFTLDNRFNFRRDGLPVNAETVLPLGNKSALELLKGVSGIQAGISAPGGLLNQVVKRPTAGPLTRAELEWSEAGTLALAVDLSRRSDSRFGWRVTAEATRLHPTTRDSRGRSGLFAGALEWQLGADGLLELELETSHQSQPSTPGFSLLGGRLPAPGSVDPTLNLNNQSWTQPVVFKGRTGSLRYTQPLDGTTQFVVHAMQQRLETDDRVAFPFGCDAEGVYNVYCSDGRFNYYDFRSEGERRISDALDVSLAGRHTLGGLSHRWSAGLLATRQQARFNRLAFNFVGTGHVDGNLRVGADPSLTDDNTDRDERSLELRLQDAIALDAQWQLWTGLRHTRSHRQSVRTDGSAATDIRQSFSTPWLALAWLARPTLTLYASWGQGIESEVAPNRARYLNAGQVLPALRSRQLEFGIKHRSDSLHWQLAGFEIQRPAWSDLQASSGSATDSCSDSDPCTRARDGAARHRGLEAEAEWRSPVLSVRGSALLLKARREGAADAARSGLKPPNVPARSLKLQAAWNLGSVRGLALLASASHEGRRPVLPDNSVFTTGWTRLDLGFRLTHALGASRWVWRAGVDNVADTRAWKESPYQFGHAYLYPLAPRTWRLAVNVTI